MKTNIKIKNSISALVLVMLLILPGCSDDVLDRSQLNSPDDENYWTQESNLRLYANEFYTEFFVGYNAT